MNEINIKFGESIYEHCCEINQINDRRSQKDTTIVHLSFNTLFSESFKKVLSLKYPLETDVIHHKRDEHKVYVFSLRFLPCRIMNVTAC